MRMPLMYKWSFATACVVALSACVSSPSNQLGNYQLSSGVENVDSLPKKYMLKNFDLTLNQKVTNPAYPDEKLLKTMFIQKLNQALVAQNKLSQGNGMSLDITMQYKRTFEGDMFGYSKVYANNRCEYVARLSYDGKEVASFSDEAMAKTSIMDEQKAIFQNLTRLAEVITLSGNQESEEKDIEICAQRIVDRLPE